MSDRAAGRKKKATPVPHHPVAALDGRDRRAHAKWAVFLGLLWACTYLVFTHYTHPTVFRYDSPTGRETAYPISDAGLCYAGALAILTGDGWVEWNTQTLSPDWPPGRWAPYKPGWSAALAVVAAVSGRNPAAMQRIITILLALTGPAFFLIVYLFLGRRKLGWAVALAATAVFLCFPSEKSWWFENTMMTEGPTLLLGIVACAIAAWGLGRRDWDWRAALAFGIAIGILAMIRSQGRLSFAVMLALFVLGALRHFRRLSSFPVLALVGYLLVLGPYCIKTSYHLKAPFFGTAGGDLLAVTTYPKVSKTLGMGNLPADFATNELERIRYSSERTREIALHNLRQNPGEIIAEAAAYTNAYLFSGLARMAHSAVTNWFFAVGLWILAVLGALAVALELGFIAALTPVAFLAGYMAPHVVFSYYTLSWGREPLRFSYPVSWIGILYVTAGCVALVDLAISREKRLRFRKLVEFRGRSNASKSCEPTAANRRENRPPRSFWALAGVWILLASIGLILLDSRSYPTPNAAALLSDPRTLSLFAQWGINPPLDAFQAKIERAMAGNPDPDLWIGIAGLPVEIRPEDPPESAARLRAGGIPHQDRTYVFLPLIRPWKLGSFKYTHILMWGAVWEDFRPGDQVIVMPTPQSIAGEAACIVIPVKWGQ